MVVFNEEEEESKSRFDADYNHTGSSGGPYAVHLTDHSQATYIKQYGATAKVVGHGQGLGGGLMGPSGNIGVIATDSAEDVTPTNVDGNEGDNSPMVDEDDFFNQDDRDMTDYNYQKQKELQAASQGFGDDDDDDD